ncbi:MAG: iron ABC transporter permease [Miniphocaeibacter sp.]|uniref:FecCD family ABC transporter permease n=1 Tax=Miniphocaeibacter sp. TaxID=3100973 RepID=UPI0018350218|nr:iron ABC transporter permease [Gallicola sp.]
MENKLYEYKKLENKNRLSLMILLFLLLIIFIFSLYTGLYYIDFIEIIKGIFGKSMDSNVNTIIYNMRLPRVLTATLGGLGLGITGCILQSILANPLASASTLGISQGASFGAAFAIIVLGAGVQGSNVDSMNFSNPLLINISAFIFSILISFLILSLSKFKKINSKGIILAGIALSSMFQGATTLIQFFADEVQLASVVFWTFGDLGRTSWKEVMIMALVIIPSILFFILRSWDFNVLENGDSISISLGVNISRVRVLSILICSFTIAIIVSYVGLINFIGLASPHIVRRFVGSNHRYLLPGSALTGAILLLLSDLLARLITSPIILPIGAITSFLGAPLFIYILFKEDSKI